MSHPWAREALRRRLAKLDGAAPWFTEEPESDFLRFISVMAACVNTTVGRFGLVGIAASEADGILEKSALLASISSREPSIADGPLHRSDQHWLPTNHDGLARPEASAASFVDPKTIAHATASPSHLRGGGLYTSTPTTRGSGMWEMYIRLFPSSAAPKPWYVWNLKVGRDRVAEIFSAAEWTKFVENYGRDVNGMVYPNWLVAADDFAGVHVTARAIAAAQGLSFETRIGPTAPAFWDVEQTIWFRWAFEAKELLRVDQ